MTHVSWLILSHVLSTSFTWTFENRKVKEEKNATVENTWNFQCLASWLSASWRRCTPSGRRWRAPSTGWSWPGGWCCLIGWRSASRQKGCTRSASCSSARYLVSSTSSHTLRQCRGKAGGFLVFSEVFIACVPTVRQYKLVVCVG